jgi:hypothetical protein
MSIHKRINGAGAGCSKPICDDSNTNENNIEYVSAEFALNEAERLRDLHNINGIKEFTLVSNAPYRPYPNTVVFIRSIENKNQARKGEVVTDYSETRPGAKYFKVLYIDDYTYKKFDDTNSEQYEYITANITGNYKGGKKRKTRRIRKSKKSRKDKSRKDKSRKDKSRKDKSRRH